MSLTFLNPLMLLGLAAAILPILIHRLTRRKALHKDFSAVRLLLHSQKLMAKPRRLKHLLLLALRVMAVAALVLMAARPMVTRPGLLIAGGKGAKVLIIDNSASMAYREAQGQRYERAKEAAKQIINNLSPSAEVLIIPTVPPRGKLLDAGEARSMKPQEAARYADSIPLSGAKGEPGSALQIGFQGLSRARGVREIIFISDMAKSDWQTFDPGKLSTIPADVHVTFLRIGGQARDNNLAVKAVRLKEGELVTGTSVRLETIIANLSDGPADMPADGPADRPDRAAHKPASIKVQLMLESTKKVETTIDVKYGEDGIAYFDLFLDRPGLIQGQVRLSEDNLPSDDRFDFTLKVREKIKVLVVDGDPRGSMRASESYYLIHALQPGSAQSSPFQASVIPEREFYEIALRGYDALFLLNAAKPQPSKIAAFLDMGKPVFVSLGNRAVPEEYNNMTFFPWRLGDIREANAQRPERITTVDYRHEAIRQFSESGRESLESASFRKYFKVDGGGQTLLALGNKDPLLMESSFGKGKILLYTSSADADWNDLPLKAAYVPLIQGILKNAVGLTGSDGPGQKGIGEPAIPAEESDLAKLSDEDVGKLFSGMEIQIKKYDEAATRRMRGSRQELWTYLLGFLLLIVAIEMGMANRL
jgi:Aerotolerance regulator N-terminal